MFSYTIWFLYISYNICDDSACYCECVNSCTCEFVIHLVMVNVFITMTVFLGSTRFWDKWIKGEGINLYHLLWGTLLEEAGREHSRAWLQTSYNSIFTFILMDLHNIRMTSFIEQWIWPHFRLMSFRSWGVLVVKNLFCKCSEWSFVLWILRSNLRA